MNKISEKSKIKNLICALAFATLALAFAFIMPKTALANSGIDLNPDDFEDEVVSGVKNGWYYSDYGANKIDKTYTGYANSIGYTDAKGLKNPYQWYVKNGKVQAGDGKKNWGYEGLYKDANNVWRYYRYGKFQSTTSGFVTDMTRYNKQRTVYRYRIENGLINFHFEGLAETNNARYYKGGRWMNTYTGLTYCGTDKYYCKTGVIQYAYTGNLKAKLNGVTSVCYISKGKLSSYISENVLTVDNKSKKTASAKFDIDCDGTLETITVKYTTANYFETYFDDTRCQYSSDNLIEIAKNGYATHKVSFISLSATRHFICHTFGNGTYQYGGWIGQYNPDNKNMQRVVYLPPTGGFYTGSISKQTKFSFIGVTPTSVKVSISCIYPAIGRTSATYEFKYYEGYRFKVSGINSLTVTPSSSSYTLAKALTFSKTMDEGGNPQGTAFTAKKGSKVKLTKIYLAGSYTYGYFTQGKNGGWALITNKGLFSNVK